MQDPATIEKIRAFNRFYTNVIGVVDRHLHGSPFSLTEARILLEIFHNGGCNARTIRETLNVDEGYLSRTIDKLVRQGLVTKHRSPDDRRVFLLSLSGKGGRAFRKLNRETESAIGAMIDHLSGEEADEIVASMRRIQELLEKTESQRDPQTRRHHYSP